MPASLDKRYPQGLPLESVDTLKELEKVRKTANTVMWSPDTWRFSRSLANLSVSSAECLERERKTGRVKDCTHYMEVASGAVELAREMGLGLPDEVIAFLGYGHDFPEDNLEQTPRIVVERDWAGSSQYKDLILDVLTRITDDPSLRFSKAEKEKMSSQEIKHHAMNRMKEQVRLANEDPSKITSIIRFMDKFYTALREDQCAIKGEKLLYSSIEQCNDYYEPRIYVVENLNHIPDHWKNRYFAIAKDVQRIINTNPAVLSSKKVKKQTPFFLRPQRIASLAL